MKTNYDFRYIEIAGEVYYIPGMVMSAAKTIAAVLLLAAPLAVVVAAYIRFA